MARPVLTLSLLALGLDLGCTLDRTVATARLDAASNDAGFDAGSEAEIEQRWGQFSATLPIPACLDGDVLTVDSAADDLEGGTSLSSRVNAGASLSLREALFIAANSPGPHRIFFDAVTFAPGSAPTIVITEAGVPYPLSVDQTCIDARERAVIVDFQGNFNAGSCTQPCMWRLGPGSQMTGLVIKGRGEALRVNTALVAGNRFSIAYKAILVNNGAVIGPWNVFRAGQFAIETEQYFGNNPVMTRIEGNYFGVDPISMRRGGLQASMGAFHSVEFANNVVASGLNILSERGKFHHNRFVEPTFTVVLSGGNDLGPGNAMRGSVILNRELDGGLGNRFFESSIDGELRSDGLTATITEATPLGVKGTCPAVAGTVELFKHELTLWSPLASTACLANGDWSISSDQLRPSMNVSTLFTEQTARHTGPFGPERQIP